MIVNNRIINIPSSDIVSFSMIHNYDTMTFPIIRLRLYSDISIIQMMTEYPNDIHIRGNLDGGIYEMNDEENKSPTIVNSIKNIPFQLKVYIENKNIPTSSMDQYGDGMKKTSNLNDNVKVPIELYCYDDQLIHAMKAKVPSIYRNMSFMSVIKDFFNRNNIFDYHIDPSINQTKYDQILIPNLNIGSALSFFDTQYGLYAKGAQLYGDIDKLYLCDTNVCNGTLPIPIYVDSYKNNTDMGGMKRVANKYYMETMASNVSVLTETDIERTLNSENITAVNIVDLSITVDQLKKLYDIDTNGVPSNQISIPNLIHKTNNSYLTTMHVARIDEKTTKIDISGVGFDIAKMKINSRYNLVFESPMRGSNMNQFYRPAYICHVFSNLDSDLFIAQTTMTLCTN